ncbi:hypothetical protein BOTBODRAFT_40703 [Botryobasidium botryosum FD-172 SS1]|uniref:F-box domain-containing protein n=1 Tax=Botryobasidium botryosum (strain FD-172 SS1) TaxID=930990 RepID=A0A067N9U7_BOTB1|nr:hypothetical protein BOTBODRAFT_40703 [Botryobasidium botryosum FD-172 SS1]
MAVLGIPGLSPRALCFNCSKSSRMEILLVKEGNQGKSLAMLPYPCLEIVPGSYGKSILTPRIKEWWSETTEPIKSISVPRPSIQVRSEKRGWRRTKRGSSKTFKGLLSAKFQGKAYYDWIQRPDPKALKLPLEILEQVIFWYAAGDRQSARSLLRTCKFLNALITPVFYRVVTLHDRRALHLFAQALDLNSSNTTHIQHLWIGTKSLDQAMFFPPEDRREKRSGRDKPRKYWPAREDVVNEVILDAEKVLLACHNLRSLAIPEEFLTPQTRRAEFKFRLEDPSDASISSPMAT